MALGARVGPRDVALASNPPNLGQQVVVADLGEPFERGAALLIHRTHLVLLLRGRGRARVMVRARGLGFGVGFTFGFGLFSASGSLGSGLGSGLPA